MESLKEVLSKYLIFVIVFAICLVIITILTFIYGRKNSKKSIYLFGAFMDFTGIQTMSLTLIMLNFLLLCFSLATKLSLSYAICIVSILLILVSSILSMGILTTIINIGINAINLAIVYFGSLVNNLRLEVGDAKYLYLQIAIMVLGLLFYFFTSFLFIKSIRKKELSNETH